MRWSHGICLREPIKVGIAVLVVLAALMVAPAKAQEKQRPRDSTSANGKPRQSAITKPTPTPQPNPASRSAEAYSDRRATPRFFTGRPGELEPEEEDRVDAIIERFLQHDLGVRPDPKAVQEFQALGVEAIPALVRALNRTAPLAQKCPPAMIARKINSLLVRVQDPEVCDFVRREVGAGIRSGPNVSFLDSVRLNALLRKRQLQSQPPVVTKSLLPTESEKSTRSPGDKP